MRSTLVRSNCDAAEATTCSVSTMDTGQLASSKDAREVSRVQKGQLTPPYLEMVLEHTGVGPHNIPRLHQHGSCEPPAIFPPKGAKYFLGSFSQATRPLALGMPRLAGLPLVEPSGRCRLLHRLLQRNIDEVADLLTSASRVALPPITASLQNAMRGQNWFIRFVFCISKARSSTLRFYRSGCACTTYIHK